MQRAGTHIIVYMDESYCHGNHAISRTWNEDGVIPNRPRGKGALMIIVHAMTRDGFLLPPGERYDVDEWKCGPVPTAEMIFRAKYATKHRVPDYHDTMDSAFFMYWVENRLVPAFENRYPGKKMVLVCDNAPYHRSMGDDGFTPNSLSKTEIVEKLGLLPRKRNVPRLRSIKVKPYRDNPDQPELPSTTDPTAWDSFVFVDDNGKVWHVDGVNDEGYGDAVIYARVGPTKFGTVESTLVPDFITRLDADEHCDRWYFLGYGDELIRAIRAQKLLGAGNKLKSVHRESERASFGVRTSCHRYIERERRVVYTYPSRTWLLRYDGNGFQGKGGPKAEWLRFAVNEYLQEYYPELQMTDLQKFFRDKGWVVVFTVPYWTRSQPIEQVWAYVKFFVALRWFPGRTMVQLRSQIICGMYSILLAGAINECWKEPSGLKPHTGLTPELALKFILHFHKDINEFIINNKVH